LEVRNIIKRNYKHAEQILRDNLVKLDLMAEILIKYETIDKKQIDAIMQGKKPKFTKLSSVKTKKPEKIAEKVEEKE
jgi:cell division protease FtsH